ncbi:coenzyme A biosynthesis bifunctional protein CoaBC [Oxobacter pfennigii]|uniref:Coenzyme A biosynthesis bifunctional protein CoaBC n=1 Tax=Oxobacter pfennigii TaxID=36849 RepID=A0A0P8WZQ4_9CLOT|nr:bifunctional phosphopantothenoylcysteine decarboxylase/phosphopantothenate--cysteine ligase CoaBC [Oxobacter pfennigii]KPU43981.1 coenzyme A biosynthesis bifunctional protein CoaBC [Oxobacter pfennigii]
MLSGKNIVLGVSGGIAAYKALDIVSKLKKLNANVDVIMTSSAAEFIKPLSFQALSQNPVIIDMFEEPKQWEIQHISLAKKADIFVIAPATANIIGKVANGIADDMLSTTVMATKAPVLLAPAMNTNMYESPIVKDNIHKLKKYGYLFIEPASGRLACGDVGKGKLPDVSDIVDEISLILYSNKDYNGKTVLVTAGPTQEEIDPVRYISNHSSGKMGYAIAEAARNRGAEVILVTGPVALIPPRYVQIINVTSNADMYNAVMDVYDRCDIIIKAAAVADYKPAEAFKHKIKKTDEDLNLSLKKNIDILKELGKIKGSKILVGFAAETDDLINNAKTKIEKKNLDMIVANDVTVEGSGFKADENLASIIKRDGEILSLNKMSKSELAHKILDIVKTIN